MHLNVSVSGGYQAISCISAVALHGSRQSLLLELRHLRLQATTRSLPFAHTCLQRLEDLKLFDFQPQLIKVLADGLDERLDSHSNALNTHAPQTYQTR